MTISAPTAGCDSTEKKHIVLNREINNMNEIKAHLEELRNRITGEPSATCDPLNTKDSEPCLHIVLLTGDSRLRETRNDCHDIINNIKDILF